jgi:pimeloyl-ACP methyl ester carboxylesterase
MHIEAQQRLRHLLDAADIRRCASIAAIYAGSIQDPRICGLVLISPHYFVEAMCLASIEQARTAYEQGDLRSRLARYHDHVDIAFRGWNGAWLNPDFRSWNITGCIAQIRVPILQIQGTDDAYGTEAQPRAAEQLARSDVQTVMIPGARHAPHLETPQPALNAVAGFTHRVLGTPEPQPRTADPT